MTSYGTDETLEYQRDTGYPLGRWALSGNFSATRLTQESPWGLRIAPNGNVFIVRTGEAFGSSGGGGEHEHAELHLTNAQMYEFDVRNGNFLRAHVNGNDHGMEFPTGFDFVPGWTIDCNANQIQDSCDIAAATSADADTNGIPDECESDCNGNGTLDRRDLIPFGTSFDCNANLVPDECDAAAGIPGACEVATEQSCTDGFDNDRDGLRDCADSDCDSTGACLGTIVEGDTFAASSGSFSYVEDPFRATAAPAYASGAFGANYGFEGTGGLSVSLGGIDGADILGMSGGWQLDFTLAQSAEVLLTFRYRMEQTHGYEPDEFSQVLVSIDGSLVGTMGNDYVVQLTGDGQGGVGQPRATQWQQQFLNLGTLTAGSHTLILGGYNNKKTLADEETTLWFDDIGLTTVEPAVCGDGILSPGEDCDDGGTVDGDCCSSACAFESVGSSCDDADICTEVDSCDGAGLCAGTPIPECGAPVPAAGRIPRTLLPLGLLLLGMGLLGTLPVRDKLRRLQGRR